MDRPISSNEVGGRMAKKKIAGHRQRAFRIRSHEVPDAVHVLNEFIYDMCLELGICPSCQLRILHREKGHTYSKCIECLTWHRRYSKERGRQ